ncbi:glycosyltransferase family 4 protein [Mycobacterium sp. Aquia_213]|uniref:glycosyltransferase family 4 protein n=1 Tax=Mycobacterium sp. Aquia_213 TaxID=2991728 RepID=UPI00227034C8|nr:glycosyltransferase family 4 protein [Mycobacterium sp. Aquia_213]WAC89724.1 glycosyltransferase family 4 protein [Mycobacterium sp. Aquia_213]
MKAPARLPVRVLTIGNAPAGPNSRGGMATMMRLLLEDGDARFRVRLVPTYNDASLAVRMWTGISGMLKASALLLFGFVDVFHVHYSWRGSIVRKAVPLFVARLRGVPTIVHGHTTYFFSWLDELPRPVGRAVRLALRADYSVVLGEFHVKESCASLGVDESRTRVLYNPVVVPALAPSPRTEQPLRAVALGRLGENKGSYDLVRAIGMLPNDIRDDLRVTLAGDGDVDEVRELVRGSGLEDTIAVVGWVGPDERDRLLAESAIFLLPSYSEGLPMAVLEAMASGVVPVTTAVGAIPEVVTDGVNGVLISPGEPEQLAAALQSLIVDAELRNRLAAAAYTRAKEFDVAHWREALHDLWLAAASR